MKGILGFSRESLPRRGDFAQRGLNEEMGIIKRAEKGIFKREINHPRTVGGSTRRAKNSGNPKRCRPSGVRSAQKACKVAELR